MSNNNNNNNNNEEEVIDLLDASSSEDDEPQNANATQRQPRTCLQRPRFARKRGREQSSGSSDVDDYNYEDEADDIYNINDSTLSQHDIPAVASASAAAAVVSNNTSFSDGYANNNSNNNNINLFESFLQHQRQRQRRVEEVEGEVIDLQSPSPPRLSVAASVSASAAVARGINNANNSATSSYAAAASSSLTSSNNNNNSNWNCDQCTLTNPPYRRTCNACSAHRYAPSLSTAGRATVPVLGRGATVSAARRDFEFRNGRRRSPFPNSSSEEDDSEIDDYVPPHRRNNRARTSHILAQALAQTTAEASAARASLLTAHAALVAAAGGGGTASDSYEQLLQLFGDGTENISSRGASSSTISSLPTNIITNPNEELPEDKRTCYICLEEFENGDVRKCLPCLHGYHEKCVDRWLVENGVCPVCKTPVSD